MIPGMIPQDVGEEFSPPYKYIALLAVLIASGGIVAAWLGGQGILPLDPSVTLGVSILIATVVVCCAAVIMQGTYASRMVNYSEMEIRYDEAKTHFDNEEWENALLLFTELAGPKMNHKRGTYYASICYEKTGDLASAKKYIMAYLKMKPNDTEAWQMLARYHKSLFEYEEAQYAKEQAERYLGN